MLSTIWSYAKAPFVWIANLWTKFEAWVASWAPGWKTQIIAGLGAVGEGAGALQEYFTGIPLDKFITGTQVAIVSVVLFSLAFWFRRLSNYNA